MMGLIFETAREVIVEAHGEDTWDDILAKAGFEGAYTKLGNYPHDQLVQIVDAAADLLGSAPEDVWRTAGRLGYPRLHSSSLGLLGTHATSQSLLRSIDQVIHAHVRTIHPQSSPPRIEITGDDDALDIRYNSHRGLCHLAEGLAMGAVEHFEQEADVTQTECGLATGGPCHIRIRYRPTAPSPG